MLRCLLLSSLALSVAATAQHQQPKMDFGLYLSTHTFYDQGEYSLGSPASTTSFGFGGSLHHQLSKRWFGFTTLSVAYTKGLDVYRFPFRTYLYPQWDLNLSYRLISRQTMGIYTYFGYGFDWLSKSATQTSKRPGTHNNFGLWFEWKRPKNWAIFYRTDFALQHSQEYLHHFHHQVGIRFRTISFSEKTTEVQVVDYIEDMRLDTAQLIRLAHLDSTRHSDSLDLAKYEKAMRNMVFRTASLMDSVRTLKASDEYKSNLILSSLESCDFIYNYSWDSIFRYHNEDSLIRISELPLGNYAVIPSSYSSVLSQLNNVLDISFEHGVYAASYLGSDYQLIRLDNDLYIAIDQFLQCTGLGNVKFQHL